MDEIKQKLEEAGQQKEELMRNLQQLRTATGNTEAAIIKVIGRIEALTELIPEGEKDAGTK